MRNWILIGGAAFLGAILTFMIAAAFLLRDNVDELMQQARELRDSGRLEEAADLFGQVALLYPQSKRAHEALFERGDTFYIYGLPDVSSQEKVVMRHMAEEAYRKLIKQYPDSPYLEQARLYLGEIYSILAIDLRERGEQEKSMDYFELALEQYRVVVGEIEDREKQQEVLFRMAECHDGRKEYLEAAKRFKDVVRLGMIGPGRYFETAHLSLANYYHRDGEYEAVINQLRALLRHNVPFKTKQEAYTRLADLLLDLNRFQEASEALDMVQINDSNRGLIAGYRDRIERRRMDESD